MAKRASKTKTGLLLITDAEYAKLMSKVENTLNFKLVLSMGIPQKKAQDIIKLLKSYIAIIHKKVPQMDIIEEKYHPPSNEFIMMLNPISAFAKEGIIENYHFLFVKQAMREEKPFVVINLYLNTQSTFEVEQMDTIFSKLARALKASGFKIFDEKLVGF